MKKTYFDNELKNVTCNKSVSNELSRKVKATKMLIKDLINKFCVLNGSKYFSSGIFQNYLVLKTTGKYIKFFNGTTLIDL